MNGWETTTASFAAGVFTIVVLKHCGEELFYDNMVTV
jgi:hypothetical protein